jgi:hypothetical protein
MRQVSAFALAALLLAAGAIAGGTRAQTAVRVIITRASCGVSPRTVEAGNVVFRITNRSGRSATFSVAGRRVSVPARRVSSPTISLSAGRAAYSCSVAGRRIGSGFVAVTAPPQPVPEHRIAVREVNGFGEFYDRVSGAKFVPRGNNYIRLAPQVTVSGQTQVYHSTFNVGQYDSARAEAALARMAAGGYNVVRVFLDNVCAHGCTTNTTTGSISPEYVANLADFLRRSRAHGVFVMVTTEWLPAGAIYDAIQAGVRRDWFDNVNLVFLAPQGVDMSTRFWKDFIRELIRQQAPLDAIFAYSLWNEAVVDSNYPPFTLSSGRVTTAVGQSYDMGSNADRKQIIDDSFVYYIDRVRSAIREVDPTALVTMGFFHDNEPNPARRGDPRLVRTRAVIERSMADFVDIHPYADDELTFPQFMQNYGVDGPTAKPIIIGEFGGAKRSFESATRAATAFTSWQQQSCAYGVDGWLLWTWDTNEQPDLWNALMGGGLIEQALAPKNRPDPCA